MMCERLAGLNRDYGWLLCFIRSPALPSAGRSNFRDCLRIAKSDCGCAEGLGAFALADVAGYVGVMTGFMGANNGRF